MAGPADPQLLQLGALVVGAAFLPPLVYVIIVRSMERFHREPWGALLASFFYGAFISVLVALFLEFLWLHSGFSQREYQIPNTQFSLTSKLLLVLLAAPLVEEFAKGLGVARARRGISELEDGIVYGATVGLGFSATENLIYELNALHAQPDYSFVGVAALRSITSSFLHATATGILGYGIARRILQRRMLLEVFPYYVLAVLTHATFNGLATVVEVSGVPLAGLAFIVLVSLLAIRWTLARIRRLDQRGVNPQRSG